MLNIGHRMPLVIGFSRKRLVSFAMSGVGKSNVDTWGKNTLPGDIALSCYCALKNDYKAQPLFLRVHGVQDISPSLRAIDAIRSNELIDPLIY